MRHFLLFLGISISVVAAGCDSSMVMTTSILEKKANAYYDAAEYDEALRFANRLCKRKANDYDAWQLRACIQMELGNYEKALADAYYAWELMPDKVDSLRLRSCAYSFNGMHEEAIADMTAIIECSPRSAGNQTDLGYEYEQLGDYAKAIECYRAAVAINEDYAIAWNNWASVLSMAANPEFLDGVKAKRFAARAVKLADTDEDKCFAWATFGAALAELGEFSYAQKASKKALSYTEDEKVIREIKDHINGYKKQQPARYPEPVVRESSSESGDKNLVEAG